MRLSEKTIEFNFCAQATQMFMAQGRVPIWFGLTQKQEAQSGFDAARKGVVFRQFHVEGFVNQYVLDPASTPGRLT